MVVSADALIGLARKASKRQLIRMIVFFFIIDPQNNVERNLALYAKNKIKVEIRFEQWNCPIKISVELSITLIGFILPDNF